MTGKHPPLIIMMDSFVFPQSSRYLNFAGGSEVELFCHGTNQNQDKTSLITEGRDTKLPRLSLLCDQKQFLDVQSKVRIVVKNVPGKRLHDRRWSG